MRTSKYTTLAVVAALSLSVFAGSNAFAASLNSTGEISFVVNESPTGPTNPLNPDETVTVDPETGTHEPGTAGPLSIDYASNIRFGSNPVTADAQVYHALNDSVLINAVATEVPNYVQVTDNRGSNAGWHLTVTQNGQFTDGAKPLNGAELQLKNPVAQTASTNTSTAPTVSAVTLDPSGVASDVASAAVDAGQSTWAVRYGNDVASGATSITLNKPAGTIPNAAQYTTTLTWTLSDTPA